MSLESDALDFLDPILRTFSGDLRYRLNGHIASIYLRGAAQMIAWGRTKTTDRPIVFEGPPIQNAIDYADEHCAKLVTRLNDESKERLAKIISNGIEEKRGIPGLMRDIRKEFSDMSKQRSEIIARTESCDALEQAFMDRSHAMGVTAKEWVVTDPCPICEENGNAGVIGIDEVFPSGHKRPPAHPNCRCALAPAMLK